MLSPIGAWPLVSRWSASPARSFDQGKSRQRCELQSIKIIEIVNFGRADPPDSPEAALGAVMRTVPRRAKFH
jgi:hypothetical protein